MVQRTTCDFLGLKIMFYLFSLIEIDNDVKLYQITNISIQVSIGTLGVKVV